MTSSPHVARRGTGAPMILLHGNGTDHRMMLALDASFDDSGFERIYLDLPGFGETPPLEGRGGLADVAAWLSDAVDDLVGEQPFAIVGTSLGGLLARDVVRTRRDRCLGMALIVPVVDSRRERRTLPPHTVDVRDEGLLATLSEEDRRAYEELCVVQTVENWTRFRDEVLPGVRLAVGEAMQRLSDNYELDSLLDDGLDGFDRPVLIITGKQDAVVGFEDQWQLASRFPHATYASLDRCGHNAQIDQPEVVRALLRTWSGSVARVSMRS